MLNYKFMRLITITAIVAAMWMAIGVQSCGSVGTNSQPTGAESASAAKVTKPTIITPTIVAEYPHDPKAYTQGLLIHNGLIYESTGEYGTSTLRSVEIATGKVKQQVALPSELFGEGLALHDGMLYQLTWREGRCRIYKLGDLSLLREINYRGEGWGLTQWDGELYFSDGSNRIFVYDPTTFTRKRVINVRNENGALELLNELEWINGRLWANIYSSDAIAVIDPQTGVVTHYIDCSALRSRLRLTPDTDVLNGIAHDTTTGKTFVTGKNWNLMFEISVPEELTGASVASN